MATLMLNNDLSMLTRMELDLVDKAQKAFQTAQVAASVHGVFSIDDLETKTESEICAANRIAIGIGYHSSRNTMLSEQGSGANQQGRVAMVEFRFMVILAVPTGELCAERYNAGELLSVLRLGIQGRGIDGDAGSRSWAFVSESPDIGQSNNSMLYYVQYWQTKLPFSQSTRS